MTKVFVRDDAANTWVDFCASEWRVRTGDGSAWLLMTAANTKVRSADNTSWLPIECAPPSVCLITINFVVSGNGGSVTPAQKTVHSGQEVWATVVPEAGYTASVLGSTCAWGWVYDQIHQSLTTMTPPTCTGSTNVECTVTLGFTPVTATCFITVHFVALANGLIQEPSTVTISSGQTASAIAVPLTGYRVKTPLTNSTCGGVVTYDATTGRVSTGALACTGSTNVECTVTVEFELIPTVVPPVYGFIVIHTAYAGSEEMMYQLAVNYEVAFCIARKYIYVQPGMDPPPTVPDTQTLPNGRRVCYLAQGFIAVMEVTMQEYAMYKCQNNKVFGIGNYASVDCNQLVAGLNISPVATDTSIRWHSCDQEVSVQIWFDEVPPE